MLYSRPVLPLALAMLVVSSPEKLDLVSKLRAGILVGEPLAVTVATDLSEGLALHVDTGLSHSDRISAVLAIDVVYRADQVFGPISSTVWAMPFFGFGVRGSIGEDGHPDRFGFRIPAGITLLGRTEPLELFIQVAVGMSAFPDVRGTIDFGAGVRIGF